jgi:hypothetical protein
MFLLDSEQYWLTRVQQAEDLAPKSRPVAPHGCTPAGPLPQDLLWVRNSTQEPPYGSLGRGAGEQLWRTWRHLATAAPWT